MLGRVAVGRSSVINIQHRTCILILCAYVYILLYIMHLCVHAYFTGKYIIINYYGIDIKLVQLIQIDGR